ncbi:hypothetical protein FACS1894137_07340 [Spirochaetia bacterium]|nr:hypothetical protein FACS1894137_07340 [Spirochaetia bacterium]
MGVGLGENSPVVLTLGKSNYEAMINRHGQWIRWRISAKCPCTDRNTMQADPQCPHCGGLGFTYSFQPQLTVTDTILISDYSGILEVQEKYTDCVLDMVYDFSGKKYIAEKNGPFISLDPSDLPEKGNYLYVVMTEAVGKIVDAAGCENAGAGYFRVDGLQSRREGIDGLYHTAPGDIIKIEKVTDADGKVYTPDELRLDQFHINPLTEERTDPETDETSTVTLPIVGPLTVEGVKYVPPFLFALLSQNLSKEDNAAMVEAGGSAVCTFPYNCDVSEEDILTALSGTYTEKGVVDRHGEAEYDTIGAYFVTDIVSCIGKEREYKAGIDFLLVGTNYLKWLCEDAPIEGEAYSLTYMICPTYKVVKNIPQIRTSENQRLPKKAIVQLFQTYGEHRRANQQ